MMYGYLISWIIWGVRCCALFGALVYGTAWIKYRVNRYLLRVYPDELRTLFIARSIAALYFFIVGAALLYEFGINVAALLGAAGVVGFGLAYASQTSISNVISGLFLAVERPFELHDTLIVDGQEGVVQQINLVAITLCTKQGMLMRVPHEKLLKQSFINVTRLPERRFEITFRVSHKDDTDRIVLQLKKLAIERNWSAENRVTVFVSEITGSYSAVTLYLWVEQKKFTLLQREVPGAVKLLFNTAQISLAPVPFFTGNNYEYDATQ